MSGFNWQFLFVLLIFLPALPAFAQEVITVQMDTDKDTYQDGDHITITGTVSKYQDPTALVGIYDPFGNPAGFYIAQIVDGKNFSVSFLAKAGVNFKVDGTYSVSAFYSKVKQTITFDFVEKLESIPSNETTSQNTDQVDTTTDTTSEQVDTNTTTDTAMPDTTDDQVDIEPAYQADDASGDTESNETISDTTTNQADATTSDTTATETTTTNTTDNTTTSDQADTETVDTAKPDTKTMADTTIITKNTKQQTTEKTVEPSNIVEKKEEKPVSKTYDNLSVEDIELGIMLNQINLNCDKFDVSFDISYYDGMGPSLTRLCKFKEALSFYDQELANKPESVKIISNKGVVLSKLGYYDEALLHFDVALAVEPTFVSALNNKANVLYELGYVDEAHDLYVQALQIDPNYNLASKNLAYVNLYMANSKTELLDSSSVPIQKVDLAEQSNVEKNITDNAKQPDIFEQISSIFSGIASAIFG